MILKQKNLKTIILSLPKKGLNLILILAALLCTYSCNNNNQSNVSSDQVDLLDENTVIIPEDFPSFYAKFHVDPEFQLNSIQFPLSGKAPDEKWTAESWEIHKPFNDTGEFKRDMENIAGIITETIMDNNGMFYIVRRFAKLGEDWKLIYYTQGTNLDGFVPED